MAKIEVILPQMGEGIIEATITRWLADVDSNVEEDEPIIEIATDKVDSEIPAPASGILIKHFFAEGETPKVGEVLAIIDDGKEVDNTSESNSTDYATDKVLKEKEDRPSGKRRSRTKQAYHNTNPETIGKEISPFIRQYARARGVYFNELEKIEGSGHNKQITKTDLQNYIKDGRPFRNRQSSVPELIDKPKDPVEEYEIKEGEELIDLDRTRTLIAQHMVRSVHVAPHVTSFVEADITPLVEWRNRIKTQFKNTYGTNLTYTPIIVEAVVEALKEFPYINASLISDSQLVLKKYINIGIATSLPDNNLIVPVIRNADRLNLSKLALEIADKSARARKGELKPSEITGGTFTITNLGQVGNISGTPIINQPESAILAVGVIQKKPAVVLSHGVHSIGIRDILTLSLSYDHRTVDGALGGAFLNRVAQLLQEFKVPKDI